MNQIDLLLVLAQIGVGFAGFGSLATVIGQSLTKTDPEVNSIRLRGLIHISIGVILLALVPVALLRVPGFAEEDAWRIAAVIAFFAVVAISVGVLTLVGASTAFALVVTSFRRLARSFTGFLSAAFAGVTSPAHGEEEQ